MREGLFDARLHKGEKCFVYIICKLRNDGFHERPVKVGIANDIDKRIRQFQTSCPFKVAFFAGVHVPRRDIALFLERRFHDRQSHQRLHGEWFDMDPHEAVYWMIINMIVLFRNDYSLDPEMTELMLRRSFSDEYWIDDFKGWPGNKWAELIECADGESLNNKGLPN